MKVALYARVSKDEASSDGKLQDPENQIIPMKKYCEAMGWEITRIFIDKCSGGSSNRPDFQAMLGIGMMAVQQEDHQLTSLFLFY
jgi:DNA invertase Pin-like site-specific DNA recombinase